MEESKEEVKKNWKTQKDRGLKFSRKKKTEQKI